MKTIVCFGDSNTWGYAPGSNHGRLPREARWPVRLQRALGGQFEVIAEGLNGRTAAVESPVEDGRNGLPYFLPCLRSHKPVDLVVVYLGTNDVELLSHELVARSVGRLVKLARHSETGPGLGAPEVLVVCPPPFEGHELGPFYAAECAELGCELLDLAGVVSYSEQDPWHLDEAGHAALAVAVEERVRKLLG
ncbi:MAG TPA: GDSL-type esterase/lipase family protein [Gaiellaceae bacterium]|nr:GDSL-type esterase/lipase family protein [Gaiellaceae bacterium]